MPKSPTQNGESQTVPVEPEIRIQKIIEIKEVSAPKPEVSDKEVLAKPDQIDRIVWVYPLVETAQCQTNEIITSARPTYKDDDAYFKSFGPSPSHSYNTIDAK